MGSTAAMKSGVELVRLPWWAILSTSARTDPCATWASPSASMSPVNRNRRLPRPKRTTSDSSFTGSRRGLVHPSGWSTRNGPATAAPTTTRRPAIRAAKSGSLGSGRRETTSSSTGISATTGPSPP